jgi:two-component system, chemotaxis family, sensor kinase CheA
MFEFQVGLKENTVSNKSDESRLDELVNYSQSLLSSFAKEKEISQGVFFIATVSEGKQILKYLSGYANQQPEPEDEIIAFGEGFPGQVAKDGKLVIINDIPEGYMSIESGLGKAAPASLIIFPIKHEGNVLAVIELASFYQFTQEDGIFFEKFTLSVAEQILAKY